MQTCENDANPHYAHGLCRPCYDAGRRPPRPPRPVLACLECPAEARVKGRCRRCYCRQWSRANPRPQRHSLRLCEQPGCLNPHRNHGLCAMHAQRLSRRGTLEPSPPGGVFAQLWRDPERRAAIRQAQSEGAKRRWAAFRAKRAEAEPD